MHPSLSAPASYPDESVPNGAAPDLVRAAPTLATGMTMTKTKLNLKIEHQVRGRIRMKIPAAKGNAELLEQIKQTFGVIPGIEQITVNPTTGSVVLHYDEDRHDEFHGDLQQHLPAHHHPPSNEIDEIARKFEEEAEFLAEHSQLARGVVDFFKDLDRRVKSATGNTIDLKILLAGGLAVYTFFEIGADAATPMWVTLALFSLNHFAELHGSHLAATARSPAPVSA